MIRCNNCMKTFKNEKDLTMLVEYPDGTINILKPGEKPLSGGEGFRGCPCCKTDAYLMNVE